MIAHVHEAAHARGAGQLREIRICDVHLSLVHVDERRIDLSAGKDERIHPASVMRELMNAASMISTVSKQRFKASIVDFLVLKTL